VLRNLSAARTLEVAFGGGEPFAFRGFWELLDELTETTPLALHVTTNGTLIRPSTWRKGVLGQVRLSLYETTRWRDTAAFLAAEGQRWGANLLIDDQALETLRFVLDELKTLRGDDVSLLSCVGAGRGWGAREPRARRWRAPRRAWRCGRRSRATTVVNA